MFLFYGESFSGFSDNRNEIIIDVFNFIENI